MCLSPSLTKSHTWQAPVSVISVDSSVVRSSAGRWCSMTSALYFLLSFLPSQYTLISFLSSEVPSYCCYVIVSTSLCAYVLLILSFLPFFVSPLKGDFWGSFSWSDRRCRIRKSFPKNPLLMDCKVLRKFVILGYKKWIELNWIRARACLARAPRDKHWNWTLELPGLSFDASWLKKWLSAYL